MNIQIMLGMYQYEFEINKESQMKELIARLQLAVSSGAISVNNDRGNDAIVINDQIYFKKSDIAFNELIKFIEKIAEKKENSKKDERQFNWFSDYIFPMSINKIESEIEFDNSKTLENDLEKQENSNEYWPFSWVNTSIANVSKMIKSSIPSGEKIKQTIGVLKTLSISDYYSMYSISMDYWQFSKKNKQNKGATTHNKPLSEDEKLAFYYYKKMGSLSDFEKKKYYILLKKIEESESKKQEVLYEVANQVIQLMKTSDANNDLSRKELEKIVITNLSKLSNGRLNSDNLSLDDYQIIELVISKILLILLDKKADGKKNIVFLAAAYNEHNRLKKKSEYYTGEDFLRVKVRQLEFLFGDLKNYNWTLTFVDDQAKSASAYRSIDEINRLNKNDPNLAKYSDKIVTLDYEDDLREEISDYKNKEISTLSYDDFAKKSVKGGAIETGLRYISRTSGNEKNYKTPIADAIICTDCDTSVNLANAGILLNQLQDNDIAIGSRRIEGAHVIGKSAERHMQSFLFNTLVRFLLNVQATDTQVGAKAFKPEVIKEIHSGFNELSMSFDVEILRLAIERGFRIGEDGIVWIDSDIESYSADQGMNMFSGLLAIYERVFAKAKAKQVESEKVLNLNQLAIDLAQEKQFLSLISLAKNHKWSLLIKHANEFYDIFAPKQWINFVSSIQVFIQNLAENKIDIKEITNIITSIKEIAENMQDSNALNFFIHEFKEVFDIIELLHNNIDYAKIIAPMLFGENIATKALFKSTHKTFYQYILENPSDNDMSSFQSWFNEGKSNKDNIPKKERILVNANEVRIQNGKERLSNINKKAGEEGKKIRIALVLHYNIDNTSPAYIDKVINQKMEALKKEYGEFKNIEWKLLIVDGRKEKKSAIERYIDQVLEQNETANIKGEQIHPESCHEKADAVRCGMNYLADPRQQSDYVGYIDFSDKINILEMSNLVAEAVEEKRLDVISIASRRQEESNVENKPLTFVLRSHALNLMVKGMFPLLYPISDTQTGFKIFSTSAWNKIDAAGLECHSLAFDIELLQQAARQGVIIKESPVDFIDASQDKNDQLGEEQVSSMFSDLIEIRGRIPDSNITKLEGDETRLLAGGAENVVYLIGDSIIKIPHQVLDPEFCGVLKNFIFKNSKSMSVADQSDKLISSGLINQLLTHPGIKSYIPMLRSWKELNIFIMKLITSYENKNYKSVGYETAEKLGRDLVVPFRFVDTPFKCKIDGVERHFFPEDNIKQSVKADTVFKDKFISILNENIEQIDKLDAIKKLISEGITLFYHLWRRGLFDLDTNFMCDTGFYADSNNQERLMVLDPGELIDDLSQITRGENIKLSQEARVQFVKRYDYIEMGILLDKFPEIKEKILEFYRDEMNSFYDFMEKDLIKPKSERFFGQDQREENASLSDFKLIYPARISLPSIDENLEVTSNNDMFHKKNKALEFSKKSYQKPYKEDKEPLSLKTQQNANYHFIHIVPENKLVKSASELETCIPTQTGSIVPAIQALAPYYDELQSNKDNKQSMLVILDAGTATRSSLLKFATENRTKGSIIVGEKPLYLHAVDQFSQLLSQSKPLQSGYVILASSDDLAEFSEKEIDKISTYFSGEPKPGLYWCDLPDGGKNILPLTVKDTYEFLLNNPDLTDFFKGFLYNIPYFRGFIEAGNIDILHQALLNFFNSAAEIESKNTVNANNKKDKMNIPGINFIADYYQQYIQYNAALKIGGMKTPFFMIMSDEFYQDIEKSLMPLLPEYVLQDITWENIIIQCDKFIWMKSGKPGLMSDGQWLKIWEKLQELKEKHHIDTGNDVQNVARVFSGKWHNFDDPVALIFFLNERYNSQEGHKKQYQTVSLLSDRVLSDEVSIKSNLHGNIKLLHSNVSSTVNIVNEPNKIQRKGEVFETLIYNIDLPEDKELTVFPNHLITMINGTIYSIPIGIMTKEELKSQPVYKYGDDGLPLKDKNGDFVSQPYSKFVKEIEESLELPINEKDDDVTEKDDKLKLEDDWLKSRQQVPIKAKDMKNASIFSRNIEVSVNKEPVLPKAIKATNPKKG